MRSKHESGESLTRQDLIRYSRQIALPNFGRYSQEKLKASSVLIIGAGGLGSPASLYLAAAGVGRIGVIDFDFVELNNLQRQILYTADDVGKPKHRAAQARLKAVNSELKITAYGERFTSKNALVIAKKYDIVVDGSDNYTTRYLANDACVLLGKPLAHGAVFRSEGQASVFHAARGPCYRCIYPEPPEPDCYATCAETGVLGVTSGVIGLIQATEVIKLITGKGEPLIGRLLHFDALSMSFRTFTIEKKPTCPICGEKPTIQRLMDCE